MKNKKQSLGAFLQCYKNPYATYKALESFRNHYPTSSITLLSDNGYDYTKMAEHFGATYIHEKEQVFLTYNYGTSMDLEKNIEGLIRRLKLALSLCQEEYMMWLEDDVSVNQMIQDIFIYDLNGFCPNTIHPTSVQRMAKKYHFLNPQHHYHFSGHGGSVFHVANMLRYLENNEVIEDLWKNWQYYDFASNIGQDIFYSLIIILNQGSIGPYEGHLDCHSFNPAVTVQHQYKACYGSPLHPSLEHLCRLEEKTDP